MAVAKAKKQASRAYLDSKRKQRICSPSAPATCHVPAATSVDNQPPAPYKKDVRGGKKSQKWQDGGQQKVQKTKQGSRSKSPDQPQQGGAPTRQDDPPRTRSLEQ